MSGNLTRVLSPSWAEHKKALGLCRHYRCQRPRRAHATDCEVCKKRKSRKADDVRYAYDTVKAQAVRRGIGFSITLEQFREWDRLHNYTQRRGRNRMDCHLERIDKTKPYSVGNIHAHKYKY